MLFAKVCIASVQKNTNQLNGEPHAFLYHYSCEPEHESYDHYKKYHGNYLKSIDDLNEISEHIFRTKFLSDSYNKFVFSNCQQLQREPTKSGKSSIFY